VKKYPESLQDFFEMFATDEECREYLIGIRWVDGFVCPHCKGDGYWKYPKGILRCKSCLKDISVTAGTVFHGRHLSLRIWFLALWSVVSQKNGISALGLSNELGIKRQMTGWHLLSTIRTAMVRQGRERLQGLVEVDEIFIGGVKPGKRGRGALGKALVLVAVEDKEEKGYGRIRMSVIPDATAVSLHSAIERMVEPGSIVRTDDWKSYTSLPSKGYKHVIMKRNVSIPGDDPTPLVHRIASLVKRWLLGTHQGGVHIDNLPSYLDEFVFRFNRRKSHSRGMLFYRLVQGMLRVIDKG
jgi:transposase-like protein